MDTGLRTKAENSNGKLQTDNGHPPAEVRLKKPQAHSSLRHLQCKEAIRRFKGAEKTTGRKDENVFVQNIEITKKLNFAPTQTIFRNLLPINVNDSIVMSNRTKVPRKPFTANNTDRIPVPNLHDFLKPVDSLAFSVNDDIVEEYVPTIYPRENDYRVFYKQYKF